MRRLFNGSVAKTKRRRRYFCKTNAVTGVKQQTIAGSVPQPSNVNVDNAPTVMQTYGELEQFEVPQSAEVDVDKAPTVIHIEKEMQQGEEPQQICSPSVNNSSELRESMDNIAKLFLTQRKCVSVDVCYRLLQENTREYLRAFGLEGRLYEVRT